MELHDGAIRHIDHFPPAFPDGSGWGFDFTITIRGARGPLGGGPWMPCLRAVLSGERVGDQPQRMAWIALRKPFGLAPA